MRAEGIWYSTCETEKRWPTFQWQLYLIKEALIDDQLTVAPRLSGLKCDLDPFYW